MKTRNLFGTVCASVALAACGGGGGDGVAQPAAFEALAFLPNNVAVPTLSANVGEGVQSTTVTISAASDGTLTLGLPGGNTLTLTNADIAGIGTRSDGTIGAYAYRSADADVDILLGRDFPLDKDTYLLARVDLLNTSFGFETHAVAGEAPSSLPTGSATYRGVVIGSRFDGGVVQSVANDYISGTSTIVAQFGAAAPSVDVTFGSFADGNGNGISGSITGTSLPFNGATYGGVFNGTFAGQSVDGDLLGGFFGPTGGTTAGVFDVENTAGTLEFVGGFDGDLVP